MVIFESIAIFAILLKLIEIKYDINAFYGIFNPFLGTCSTVTKFPSIA